MDRKLASIRKISEIIPHSNADSLELAIIDGWQVIVKKGEFQPGDLCVYFEIDSFLPREEQYHFLARNSYRKTELMGEGYKLRTIRLRGELSQGLALPLKETMLKAGFSYIRASDEFQWFAPCDADGVVVTEYGSHEGWIAIIEGGDLTEALNVKKWEVPPPTCLGGKIRGNYPDFIPKTDQERVQNLIGKISKHYYDEEFEMTIKLDGSSMTIYKKDDHIGVCSRNLEIEEDEMNAFWQAARKHKLVELLQSQEYNVALQGELVGPGIQKNPEKLDEREFRLFDIFLIDEQRYATPEERVTMVEGVLAFHGVEIPHVPIIATAKLSTLFKDHENLLQSILNFADGASLNPDVYREGVVFKSVKPVYKGRLFTFKAISNKFLLSEAD